MPDFEPDLADLEAILSEFGHRQVALIGHSDGGNIAVLYAFAHPDQITRLTVIAAHIYIEPKMISGIHGVRENFESDPRFQSQMRRVHGENTEKLFWGWFNGWTNPGIRDWDMRSQLTRIPTPTLVVQGSADEHASGASHMLPQQMPDKFNPRVLKFLERVIAMQSTIDGK